MTEQQYNLRLAISCYFHEDTEIIIPPDYLDHIINAYNRCDLPWDTNHAAAFTLLSAFYDSVLQKDDLSLAGKIALQWAEHHIDNLEINNKQSTS